MSTRAAFGLRAAQERDEPASRLANATLCVQVVSPAYAICAWAQTRRNGASQTYFLLYPGASANSEQAYGVVTHFPKLS